MIPVNSLNLAGDCFHDCLFFQQGRTNIYNLGKPLNKMKLIYTSTPSFWYRSESSNITLKVLSAFIQPMTGPNGNYGIICQPQLVNNQKSFLFNSIKSGPTKMATDFKNILRRYLWSVWQKVVNLTLWNSLWSRCRQNSSKIVFQCYMSEVGF